MGNFDFKCKSGCSKECRNRDQGDQVLYNTLCTVRFLVDGKEYETAGIYSGYGWVDIYDKFPLQEPPEEGHYGWYGHGEAPSTKNPSIQLHLKEFQEFFDHWDDVHHIAESADCWTCCIKDAYVNMTDGDVIAAYNALASLPSGPPGKPNVDYYVKQERERSAAQIAVDKARQAARARLAAAAAAEAAAASPAEEDPAPHNSSIASLDASIAEVEKEIAAITKKRRTN